jgi:hypothetical protein
MRKKPRCKRNRVVAFTKCYGPVIRDWLKTARALAWTIALYLAIFASLGIIAFNSRSLISIIRTDMTKPKSETWTAYLLKKRPVYLGAEIGSVSNFGGQRPESPQC